MTRVYYREAVGALMVFDVTRASTFDAVLKWKDDLDSKVRRPNKNGGAPFFLLHSVPLRGAENACCTCTCQPQPHPERVWNKMIVS